MEKKKMNKKALKFGSIGIGLTAFMIAIVVILNVVISQLPATWTKIDTTADGIVSFSDATREFLAGIDTEVTIYHVAEEDSEDAYITQLLSYYDSDFDNIKVKTVDPVKNPTFTSEYTETTLNNNSIIVESEKRNTVVDGGEFFQYEIVGMEGTLMSYDEFAYYEQIYASYYGQTITANEYFNGETVITSAINYVTTDVLPTMYTLTGHGETALADYIATDIADTLNITMKDLEMLAGDSVTVPDDAAIVFINAPTKDITADESKALIEYLDRGGNIILTTSATFYKAANVPNLDAVVKYMGLVAEEGLITEADANSYYQDVHTLLPTASSTGYLSGYTYYVVTQNAHGIGATDAADRSVSAVFETSASATLDGSDAEAQIYYPAFQSTIMDDETGETAGSLFWFGTELMFAEDWIYYNYTPLATLLVAACEMDAPIEVLAKNISNTATLTVTETDNVIWSALYVVIIPAAILVGGFCIWFTRRRK